LAGALAAWVHPSARASLLPGAANASVLTSQSLLVQQSVANTTSLNITGAGQLFVTLTDLGFVSPFSSLTYALASATASMTPMTAAGTTITLAVTGPTTLYADVFATPGGAAGLFNLTATFLPSAAAVPLPSGISMLGGYLLLSLLGLGVSRSGPTSRSGHRQFPPRPVEAVPV
jgi:hypothetical protein